MPPKIGRSLRRQKDAHRPAAVTVRGNDVGHVELVDVRSAFAIHLDRDEAVVERLGDGGVAERLTLHDVAPVARRVADGQEDRSAEVASTREGSLAPRVPVDWVLGMHPEVWRCLVGEAVRHVGSRTRGILPC